MPGISKETYKNRKQNRVGEEFVSNQGCRYKIIEYNGCNSVIVEFMDEHKYRTITTYGLCVRGMVRNPYCKTVYGVGFLGIGNHQTAIGNKMTREYNLWHRMMARCYSEKRLSKDSSYRKANVCERWHNYQNFCDDLPLIENYDLWLKNPNKKISLDKDVKQVGVEYKVYSLETCLFLTHKENNNELTKRIEKGVIGINLKTGEEVRFKPINDCTKFGFQRGHIIKCCNGERKTHKGYTWKYE